jgi:hypothetical protein
MRYTEIMQVSVSTFKRLTGVTKAVFHQMVEVVSDYKQAQRKHPTRGRQAYKVSVEDSVLMLLMYYREYRTFLHISATYGISEMQCWRIITGLEKMLLQSEHFHLPGRKALQEPDNSFAVIVVDVSEHPVERPKKNNAGVIRVKRSDTH